MAIVKVRVTVTQTDDDGYNLIADFHEKQITLDQRTDVGELAEFVANTVLDIPKEDFAPEERI